MAKTTRSGNPQRKAATAKKVAAAKGKKSKEVNEVKKSPKINVDALPVKYWVFEMVEAASGPVCFESASDAQVFRKEYKELIMKERRFRLENKFLEFQAERKNRVGTVASTPKASKGKVAIDVNSAQKWKDLVASSMPRDEVMALMYTTSHSELAAVIIMFKNADGKQTWVVKPEFAQSCLVSYAKVLPNRDGVIQQAMDNMEVLAMRDPTSQDSDKQLVVPGRAKRDADKGDGFAVFLLVTYIKIPYKKLKTQKAEASWLTETGSVIANHVRNVMLLPEFIDALQVRVPFEKYFKAIMKPDANYVNYPQFLKQAVVRTQIVDGFSRYLVRTDAQCVATKHWKARLNKRKYPEKKMSPTAKRLRLVDMVDDSDDDGLNVEYDDDDEEDNDDLESADEEGDEVMNENDGVDDADGDNMAPDDGGTPVKKENEDSDMSEVQMEEYKDTRAGDSDNDKKEEVGDLD